MFRPEEFAQILAVFVDEAGEILTRMEHTTLTLEKAGPSPELLNSIFRGAHTIKGNALSLELQAVAEMSHAMEDVLDQLRSGMASVSPSLISVLLSAVDAIREMLAHPDRGAHPLDSRHRRIHRSLIKWCRASQSKGPKGGQDETSPESVAPANAVSAEPPTKAASRTLRVDVGTLDVLMNLAGEITTARERLSRACEGLGPEGADALEILRDSEQLYVDLHDTIVRARLVALGPMFRQQTRTLRDAMARTGKRAELTLVGEDVLVDTSLIDSVRESLVHIVRNALDHGIEAPEEREKAGKDPCGSIALRATRRGSSIVIEVEDDGDGFDRAGILKRAKERGLAAGDADLSPAEIDRLLFAPGFTTSAAVTDLSGRGVGLDVVRRRVEALGGAAHIESAPGVGTTVSLRVPLTVAIIEAYHVVAGGCRYVIPADAVLECREWSTETPNHAFTERNGTALPCVRLSSALGASAATPPREEMIVVDYDGVAAGLVVDSIIGSSPTVVKPLGFSFSDLPGLAGFTVLGDGEVAPILDVGGVIGRYHATAEADR